MDMNELKSAWGSSGGDQKGEKELKSMARINSHPVLRKIRLRMAIEAVLLTFVLVVYYDWFDGNTKPLFINLLLGISIVLFIVNDVVSYYFAKHSVKGANLMQAVMLRLAGLRRMAVLSLLSSLFYGIALVVFLVYNIAFTGSKYLILGAIVAVFLLILFTSYKSWQARIKDFSKVTADFQSGA